MDIATLAWTLLLANGTLALAAWFGAGWRRPAGLRDDPWHAQLAGRLLAAGGWLALALAGWHPGSGAVLGAGLLVAAGLALEAGSLLRQASLPAWRAVALTGLIAAAGVAAGSFGGDAVTGLIWSAPALPPLLAAWRLTRGDTATPRRRALAASAGALGVLIVLGAAQPPALWPALLAYLAYTLLGGLGFVLLAYEGQTLELARLATVDPLTDVLNRRGLFNAVAPWMALARRPGQPTSVLMFDPDHFKRINDSYGHAAGDLVLKTLADVVRRQLRDSDTIGRLGGEQFAILLPRTGLAEAEIVAERIRGAVEAAPMKAGRAVLSITVSMGLTAIEAHDSPVTLFQRADAALAQAKEAGRNRVGVVNGALAA